MNRVFLISCTFFLLAQAACKKPARDYPSQRLVQTSVRPYADPADQTFPIGPSLVRVERDTALVMWRTDGSCEGSVAYGAFGSDLRMIAHDPRSEFVHVVELVGLKPGSRFSYRVSACGKSSAIHSFYTAPPVDSPVRFTVWGDNRTHPDSCARVVQAMYAAQPDFTINTGDVVTDGNAPEQWRREFFEPLRRLAHSAPTYVAVGNHENNAPDFYRYLPYAYPEKLRDHARFGSHYSFSYGNVFVMIVDTNNLYFTLASQANTPVREWIEEQLASPAARQATWRIAAGHEPGYSESWSPGKCDKYVGMPAIRDWLLPLLSRHDFHAYFSGHTHSYERGSANGIVYVIAGGGGAGLDQWCRDLPQTEVVKLAHHYVLVEAGEEKLKMTAYEVPGSGEPFDQVIVDKKSKKTKEPSSRD